MTLKAENLDKRDTKKQTEILLKEMVDIDRRRKIIEIAYRNNKGLGHLKDDEFMKLT